MLNVAQCSPTLLMAKDELIDAHVSISQCKKAATALLTHAKKVAEKKAESELLPGKEENVWLVLSVKKVSPEKKLKPFRMYVRYYIFKIFMKCLFCR